MRSPYVLSSSLPPRWRLRAGTGPLPAPGAVTVETVRPDGGRQTFAFADGGDFLESLEEIPEPHAFTARLRLDGPAGAETHEVAFEEQDHDGDGRAEVTVRYDAKEQIIGREEDLNGDGGVDLISHFENGKLTSRELLDPKALEAAPRR